MIAPALFEALLWAAVVLCLFGLALRAASWLRVGIGDNASDFSPRQRLAATLRGLAGPLRSRRAPALIGSFLIDTLLLPRLLANNRLRWLAHLFVLVGFTGLVLMHALAPLIAAPIIPDYQPTLAPYLWLRNLFGVMALAGTLVLMVARRIGRHPLARLRRTGDVAFVGLLCFVVGTGFMLEAAKFASPAAFDRMTAEYLGAGDESSTRALRAYWAREFGIGDGPNGELVDPLVIEQGRRAHELACASCHDRPGEAFVSYSLSRALTPLASAIDGLLIPDWLAYLHGLACLLGLASLPFTGLLHLVSGPLGLLTNAVARERARVGAELSPAARATRRALATDSCVRCGLCDQGCSVAPLARYLGNDALLPSSKVLATAKLADARRASTSEVPGRDEQAIRAADGAFLCTDCGRCTQACPVGLDLTDLWDAGREDLLAAGLGPPSRWVLSRGPLEWAQLLEAGEARHGLVRPDPSLAPLAADRHSFARCVQCQTCTNVCPVVAHSMGSENALDLTPQRIMNLLRLGLHDLALGSRMLWSCTTCYQCQQSCPEGVRVTDIICELRSLAVQELGAVRVAAERA